MPNSDTFRERIQSLLKNVAGEQLSGSTLSMYTDSPDDRVALLEAAQLILRKFIGKEETDRLTQQLLQEFPDLKK